MAFQEVNSLDAEVTIALGGYNKKLKKENPTTAEGYYLGTRLVASKLAASGEAPLHFLKTPKGNLGIWGKTDMDRKLCQVTLGTMIRISFTGTKPSNKGQDMYLYKVEVDADNTIEVADAQSAELIDGVNDYSAHTAEADDDSLPGDEPELQRPTRPTTPTKAPDAARQAQVQAMLKVRTTKNA